MAQQLRVLVALPEDLSLIHSCHIRQPQLPLTPSLEDMMFLVSTVIFIHVKISTYRHTHEHALKNNLNTNRTDGFKFLLTFYPV